jgi:hypothetical protein
MACKHWQGDARDAPPGAIRSSDARRAPLGPFPSPPLLAFSPARGNVTADSVTDVMSALSSFEVQSSKFKATRPGDRRRPLAPAIRCTGTDAHGLLIKHQGQQGGARVGRGPGGAGRRGGGGTELPAAPAARPGVWRLASAPGPGMMDVDVAAAFHNRPLNPSTRHGIRNPD